MPLVFTGISSRLEFNSFKNSVFESRDVDFSKFRDVVFRLVIIDVGFYDVDGIVYYS